MKKKLFSLALVGVCCLVSLSACASGSESSDSKTDMTKVVTDAAKKLDDTYNDYIVSSTMTAPDGDVTFIEVKHGGASYTEYSVDDEKNVGTISYGSQDSISYVMTDYLTKGGQYYLFQTDEDGKDATYSLPDTYNKYVSDRMMLYVNDLVSGATSIKEDGTETINIGEEETELNCYKMIVKSDVVKNILGASSYGVYKSIEESSGVDSNVGKLCSYYLKDLDMNLTFSDANVIVGIDQNGILKYMSLETGGLGSRLYYSKVVVSTSNSNIRTKPDLTNSKDYTSTMSDLAEYIAQYDNYDDAVKALSSYNSNEEEASNDDEKKASNDDEEASNDDEKKASNDDEVTETAVDENED